MLNESLYWHENTFEIFKGEKFMSPSADIGHSSIITKLMLKIGSYVYENKLGYVFADNMDVHFPDGSLFRPDFIVVCADNADIVTKNIYGAIHGVPDMVVEILSKSTRNRDFGIKKDAYEANGVKEYWIIDPWSSTIYTYILRNGKFELGGEYIHYSESEFALLYEDEKAAVKFEVPVTLFPDFKVKLSDIFDWYI